MTDEQIQKAAVGELKPHDAPIMLVLYDPKWPELLSREANRIKSLLGDRALMIEHVGSTSIPGLTAKPIIDIILAVEDSSDEAFYVPILEKAGYRLTIREPDWHQHRLFEGPGHQRQPPRLHKGIKRIRENATPPGLAPTEP